MKILFFGMGSIGKRHYRLLKQIAPDYQFYAFRRIKGKNYTDGLKSVYSWEEVDQIRFQVAFICNPTNKHVETALECAKRGLNLFIEKPLSNSLEGLDTLKDYIYEFGLKVLVGCNLRFHPVIEGIKEIIQASNDRVLRFSAYCGSYLPTWRNQDYRETYSAYQNQGGGVILDLIHELDYCTWIFGKPAGISGCSGKFSDLEIDAEDTTEMILEYPELLGVVHLDYFRPLPKRTIEVITSTQLIEGDLLNGTLFITDNKSTYKEKFDIYRDLTYEKQLIHFINVLKKKESDRTTFAEAVSVLKLTLDFKAAWGRKR